MLARTNAAVGDTTPKSLGVARVCDASSSTSCRPQLGQ
jgi:hypothetical protein